MNSVILFTALSSAVLLGIYDLFKKTSLRGNPAFKVVWVANLSGLLFVLPFAGYQGALSSPAVANLNWHGIILFKAILVNTSWNLAYLGLKHLPISIASPLRASAPFWIISGAFIFFGERPSGQQWLGVGFILLAYFLISAAGLKEGIHFLRNPWVIAMLGGTFIGAMSALYDKHILVNVKIPYFYLQVWYSIYLFITQSLLVLFLYRKLPKLNFRYTLPLVGIVLVMSDLLYFRAIQEAGSYISLISPLRRSSVVISFLLGGILFKEQNLKGKLPALLGILLGILFIGLG